MAAQTAGAVQNTEADPAGGALAALLREREAEIALLRETGDALCSELDLEKLLQLVAERAQRLIGAETLLVPVLDRTCTEYRYRAACGKDAAEILGQSLPLDFGVCGWVWRHRRAWWRGVLSELTEEERNRWEHEAGSLILVPLIGKKHFLGGLAGINKAGGGDFDERDLNLLTVFASLVSIAIENAEAFQELDRARRQAEDYQCELKTLNAELERRVAERTEALEIANRALKQLALHDALTGLPNRTLLHDRLHQVLRESARSGQPLALVMLDLNGFKEVNDTLGHAAGDQLLREMAGRLQRALRASDTVGRLGGDEFAVLLPGADATVASRLVRRLSAAVARETVVGGRPVSLSASMGIAVAPAHGRDPDTLLRCADAAMYRAKRAQDRVCVFSETEANTSIPAPRA
ncbi:MAG TPA: sensor domain-containing diguanylate cyclase [Acidiferrobacterales bacterium]|jgi:diguanylate cyclase (GGDEF)-like protein